MNRFRHHFIRMAAAFALASLSVALFVLSAGNPLTGEVPNADYGAYVSIAGACLASVAAIAAIWALTDPPAHLPRLSAIELSSAPATIIDLAAERARRRPGTLDGRRAG